MSTSHLVASIYFFTNQTSLLNIGVFGKIYLWYVIISSLPPCIIYYFWTIVADLNHPMPFLGAISSFSSTLFQVWGIFFLFPSDLLCDEEFSRKIKEYLKYLYWWCFMNLQRDVLSLIFKMLPTYCQFIIAFIVILLKESNKHILLKLAKEIAGQDNERAKAWMSISLATHYALFITIKLAGAQMFTVLSIVGIDSLVHIAYAYKILQIHNKVSTKTVEMHKKKKDKEKAINRLVLLETIGGLVPLVYALGLLMAFYGPNAMLIGNVGSGIWAYKSIKNIKEVMMVLFVLYDIDVLSVLINTLVLAKSGKVNFIQYVLKFIRNYWMLLLLIIGFDLSSYFGFNDINLGMSHGF